MADQKLTALTAELTPASADLMYLVKSTGGDRQVTLSNIFGNAVDVVPASDSAYDIGTSGVRFATGYFDALDIAGAVSATSYVVGSQLRANNVGSAGSPSIRLDEDGASGGDTGLFGGSTSGFMGFAVDGTELGRFTSTKFLVGHTGSIMVGGVTAKIQSMEAGAAGLSSARFSNNTSGTYITMGKSRGATAGDFTAVSSGDDLGYLRWAGADGTDLNTAAADIFVEAQGTISSNVVPGRMYIRTANASGVMSNAISINNAQNTTVYGSVSPNTDNSKQLGTASLRYSASYVTNMYCNTIKINNGGTSSSPVVSIDDDNTGSKYGLYGSNVATATGYLGFVVNGSGRAWFYNDSNKSCRFLVNQGTPATGSTTQGVSIHDTTNPKIDVSNSSGDIVRINYAASHSGTPDAISFRVQGIEVAAIEFDTSTTIAINNSPSDPVLKDNIAPITNGIERIKALKAYSWSWKKGGEYYEGFMAPEVAEKVPFCVAAPEGPDAPPHKEHWRLNTTKTIPTLAAAINELVDKVEILEQRFVQEAA